MLPQIVIFEGIDGVGKSTQIKLLKSHYFKNSGVYQKYVEVKSFSNIPGITNKEWEKNVVDYYESFINKLVIREMAILPLVPIFIDRSNIGEHVYGKLYRGLSDKTLANLLRLNNLYERANSLSCFKIKFILYIDQNRAINYEDGQSVNAGNRNAKVEQDEFISTFNKIKKLYPKLNMSIIDITGKDIQEVHKITIEKLEVFE